MPPAPNYRGGRADAAAITDVRGERRGREVRRGASVDATPPRRRWSLNACVAATAAPRRTSRPRRSPSATTLHLQHRREPEGHRPAERRRHTGPPTRLTALAEYAARARLHENSDRFRCGYVVNVQGWGKEISVLARPRIRSYTVAPESSTDHLDSNWRDQSRVSPTSQRRRDVPCRRLVRDSADLQRSH